MKRVLGIGIVSRIDVIVKKEYRDVINMDFVKNISKSLNKYINTEDYDKECYNDYIVYRLKENVFNDNIHDLLKNVIKDMDIRYFIEDDYSEECYYLLNFDDPKFNKEDYPIVLERNLDTGSEKFGSQRIVVKKDSVLKYPDTSPNLYDNTWLIADNEYEYMVSINIEAFTLWKSLENIYCENEYEALKIINDLKKKYKNRLGKNIIFFIFWDKK